MPGNFAALAGEGQLQRRSVGQRQRDLRVFQVLLRLLEEGDHAPELADMDDLLGRLREVGNVPCPDIGRQTFDPVPLLLGQLSVRVVLDDQRGREALVPGGKRGRCPPSAS